MKKEKKNKDFLKINKMIAWEELNMIPTAFDAQPKYDTLIGHHHVVKLNLMPEDKTKV